MYTLESIEEGYVLGFPENCTITKCYCKDLVDVVEKLVRLENKKFDMFALRVAFFTAEFFADVYIRLQL